MRNKKKAFFVYPDFFLSFFFSLFFVFEKKKFYNSGGPTDKKLEYPNSIFGQWLKLDPKKFSSCRRSFFPLKRN